MARATRIPALTHQARLKRRIRKHLATLGFHKAPDGSLVQPNADKETVRTLHAAQRQDKLSKNAEFLSANLPILAKHFAEGHEINPQAIQPALQLIESGTWESDLFRLAGLTWSVPVSNGFGRRLRFLVWDRSNGKLIGIAAIGDPVFNLSVRDQLIGWTLKDRTSRLVNLMDAYVLGAVPPYNQLLGGKLVACLLRSKDVYASFQAAYGSTRGIISHKKKSARLLAITTSSSMGRSSLYNRLKLDGVPYFASIGYTGGWGHFHIPDELFEDLREFLRGTKNSYADKHRFGNGPNWRLRTTRQALAQLGINEDILRHGIQREVFWCPLADNSADILRTGQGRPKLTSLLSAGEIGELAVKRWMIGRAERRPEFREWRHGHLASLIGSEGIRAIAQHALSF